MTAKSDEVRYSFVMCNLDMAETLPSSALILITQLPDNAELVIIDGGSTDGSLEIIRNLCEEFDNVRYKVSNFDTLGGDRNYGSRLARGEFLIHQFDCDDFLYQDSVERILAKIESIDEDKWFLTSGTFNVAPTEVFQDFNYGKSNRAEDKALWRKIEESDSIRFFKESKNYAFQLSNDSKKVKFRKDLARIKGELRNGKSFGNVLSEIVRNADISLFSKLSWSSYAVISFTELLYQGIRSEFKQYRRRKKGQRMEKYGIPTNLDSVHIKEERKSQTDAHVARDMEAML